MRNINFRYLTEGDEVVYGGYFNENDDWLTLKSGGIRSVKDRQESTGMVDKNKTEIYEGDLVLYRERVVSERGEFDDYYKEITGVVRFVKGAFVIDCKNRPPFPLFLVKVRHWTTLKFEVVDNVWKNPELDQ